MDKLKNKQPYVCPVCGGSIIGDGFQIPFHCENVYISLDVEPDVDIITCENKTEIKIKWRNII